MNVCISTGIIQLQEAYKLLKLRWEETLPYWNDAVSRHFEDVYIAPLEAQVRATQMAMEQLSQMLNAAQHDGRPDT